MTQRERHTSEQGPLQPTLSPSPSWEEWYHRASPAQRQEALARAADQGILYAHQLAAVEPRRPLLSALLNGSAKDLQPLNPPAVVCHDRELDATQCEAVARAIATPDVCLIQGYPGTGKSRVVTEILLQATRRGERVLFLAPTTAALDRVLERLATHSAVCPLRCLAADESQESLSPAIARLTLAERVRAYRDKTIPAARAARDAAQTALETRRSEESVWPRMEALVGRLEQLAQRDHVLAEQRAGIPAEVEKKSANTGPLGRQGEACTRARIETLERLDTQLAGLRSELETITAKQGHLESEWERVRPLAEARKGWRVWTGAWWRAARRGGGLAEQITDLETRREELQSARARLERDIDACLAERAEAEERYQAECRRLREEEIARRQAEVDAERATVARQRDELQEQWRAGCQALACGYVPADMSRPALDAARADWLRQRSGDEERVSAAEEWLRVVADGLAELPDKLAACANVVAATTTALPGNDQFGDRNGQPAVLFDLLVLEEAHQVTESEFATAARRSRRWVLVGEPQFDSEPVVPRRSVRTSVLRTGFFQRLWQNLHADPRRLPFAWMQRDGRLVCRLRPVAADHERYVESEPVVDHPEIELRILSVPRQPPQVVEVLFPADQSIAEAKQFLYGELDELAIQTRGRAMTWRETTTEVILELMPAGKSDTVVELPEGVREYVACVAAADGETCWSTCRLRFARSADWTRARAEQWIAERLGLSSAGRTVLLTVPHRLAPPLARFLSDLLFGGACEPADRAPLTLPFRAAVEFLAVPSLASLEARQRAETEAWRYRGESHHAHAERGQATVSVRPPRLRTVKGGAGLELNLADDRPLEQLPSELRAVLPRQGLVNYLEARALVQRLEALIGDNDFQAACQRWRERRAEPCEHDCSSLAECLCPRLDDRPAVAVMALYPAQVELLRHLIRQSPVLADGPVAIEVGLPSAFGQRECLLALVSLTRSHAHRAVSYGDYPHALAQALTRAAAGLILFGDPGTLARRSQWRGALDHLDESAAQQEGQVIAQLVHYLQGHGPHPAVFHLHEGSSI